MLQNLSDDQIVQIEQHIAEQNEEQLKQIREDEEAETNKDRINRMNKSLSRIDIQLTPEQEIIIDDWLNQLAGNLEDRVLAWQVWENDFVSLLQDRSDSEFEPNMTAHIATYQHQMSIQHPGQHIANTKISIDAVSRLINSLTEEQRLTLVSNLRKTSDVLRSMSETKQTTIL